MTLISAITMDGGHYFSLISGSNNQYTYMKYLRMLSRQLDKDEPDWRETSVVLMDNARIHSTPDVLATIEELGMTVLFSGPASFEAIPVELCFAVLKRKFRKIYFDKRE